MSDNEFQEISKRGEEWAFFSDLVYDHIEKYTVPQYGDVGEDQIGDWDVNDFKTTMKRYANRIGNNARGHEEAKRDCLKMAHYACMMYSKLTDTDE